jgi:hypothetical protein
VSPILKPFGFEVNSHGIVNIGSSMLNSTRSSKPQDDIKFFGWMITQCLEPSTYVLKRQCLDK